MKSEDRFYMLFDKRLEHNSRLNLNIQYCPFYKWRIHVWDLNGGKTNKLFDVNAGFRDGVFSLAADELEAI